MQLQRSAESILHYTTNIQQFETNIFNDVLIIVIILHT